MIEHVSELAEDATPAGPLPRDPRPATTPYIPPAALTIRLGGTPRRADRSRRYWITTRSAHPGWLPAGIDAQPAPASDDRPVSDRPTWPDDGHQPALWIRLAGQWCDARLRGRERRADGQVVYRVAYQAPSEHRRGLYLYGAYYWHPHSVTRQRGVWELGPDLDLPDAAPVAVAAGPVSADGLRWWRIRPASQGQPPVLHRGDCGEGAGLPTLTRLEAVLALRDRAASGTAPCPRCRPDMGLAED
jgi:hypothetical protein